MSAIADYITKGETSHLSNIIRGAAGSSSFSTEVENYALAVNQSRDWHRLLIYEDDIVSMNETISNDLKSIIEKTVDEISKEYK